MGIVITDAASSVKTLLSSNWTAANTDNLTPHIAMIYDVDKRFDLTNKSVVVVYESATTPEPNGLGTATRKTTTRVSIDIRSQVSRAHGIKLLGEVDRIMCTKIVNPDANYSILNPDVQWVDLSDKSKNLWRWVYDVHLVKLNESRPS